MAVFRISLFKVGPYSVFQIYGNPCISRIPYSRKPPVEYCPGHSKAITAQALGHFPLPVVVQM